MFLEGDKPKDYWKKSEEYSLNHPQKEPHKAIKIVEAFEEINKLKPTAAEIKEFGMMAGHVRRLIEWATRRHRRPYQVISTSRCFLIDNGMILGYGKNTCLVHSCFQQSIMATTHYATWEYNYTDSRGMYPYNWGGRHRNLLITYIYPSLICQPILGMFSWMPI